MGRALKTCAHVGEGGESCPNLTPGTYCEEHTRPAWSGSSRRERTTSGWKQQQRARRILHRYSDEHGFPICHVCGKPGANEVDHVVPLSEGGADAEQNLRPIHSRPCHVDKTAAEAARARRRRT